MFTRILTSGLIAGALGGFIAALLQLYFVQPVLLHAELYESGALTHFGSGQPSDAVQDVARFDVMRDGLSVLFTMLIYAGYGLMLAACMSVADDQGALIDTRRGLIWGVAGFIAVQLAPGFSLPPEVPGMSAAEVGPRQVWWFATVAATGLGLWLLAFGHGLVMWILSAGLILAPHVIGAPSPAVFTGPAPTELGALFAARAFGVGLIAWVLTGAFAGWLWASSIDAEGTQS